MKLGVAWSQYMQRLFEWKGTSFSKIDIAPKGAEFFQFSFKILITILQVFQMRYVAFLYLIGVERY